MVLINSKTAKPSRRGDRLAVWMGRLLCCGCTVVLLLWISSVPLSWSSTTTLLRGTRGEQQRQQQNSIIVQPLLLSLPNTTKISTDVRGNLGPPPVMLTDGTDWIKDRWQAASDMHGTAIQGPHWVLLELSQPVRLSSVVLDWEAAFSKDYQLEGRLHPNQDEWFSLYDTAQAQKYPDIQSTTEERGQSPGVNTKTPLHVVHTLTWVNELLSPPLRVLRLTIRTSAMGWGVSLWNIQVWGMPTTPSP